MIRMSPSGAREGVEGDLEEPLKTLEPIYPLPTPKTP